MRDMVLYGILRLALWAVIWWLLTLVGVGVVLAGVLAALIAMLISILALNRLRDAAAMRWKEADERRRVRKGPPVDEDAVEEDALIGEDPAEEDAASDEDSAEEDPPSDEGSAEEDASSGADDQDPITRPDR